MAPGSHDSDGFGATGDGGARLGLGASAAAGGRRGTGPPPSLASRWRARRGWFESPRGRAVAVVVLLVSVVLFVAFVAGGMAARPRASAVAPPPPPAAPQAGDRLPAGGPTTGEPTTGGEPGGGVGGPGPREPQAPPGDRSAGPSDSAQPPAGAARPPAGGAGSAGATADPDTIAYRFPVSPARVASYGRTHHDYPATDIFAPCGTKAVSPVDGIVLEITRADHWDPGTDRGDERGGLSVTILGADGVRYYGSHLSSIAAGLTVEDEVAAGQAIGAVGHTGSARGVSCHLHFGISPPCGVGDWAVRRGVVYPWPYLDAWRRGQHTSPTDAVWRWRDTHVSACPMSG
jgi:murein DD-endopeptidase MepM/ murein hydrolase activator NlpD